MAYEASVRAPSEQIFTENNKHSKMIRAIFSTRSREAIDWMHQKLFETPLLLSKFYLFVYSYSQMKLDFHSFLFFFLSFCTLYLPF